MSRVARQVDAVLLSHPKLAHVGALPYAMAHLGLTCPVYATLPVSAMGKMCMLDALASIHSQQPFETFTKQDVEKSFERVIALKYFESIYLTGTTALSD